MRPLRKLHKKPPIFLPFRKSAAVKSAPRGKMDSIIEARELQIERKHFYVELRENERGKFLRIIEEAHGRRNSIIVPSTGARNYFGAFVHCRSPALLNHGYKAKIKRSERNSALEDNTDLQGTSDFCKAQESESAALRLLLRRRAR